ncbi:MAG: hypothetical protein F7C35_07415 [Desulfurococcales archaeon]|nr:hypothetical protein [Desulfurococcales archaeon]
MSDIRGRSLEVSYRRVYGAEFTVRDVEGRAIDVVVRFAGLLRQLRHTWFLKRGLRPVIVISDDYSSVWLSVEDGERRIYIELEVCGECRGGEGVIEVVGYDGRVFASLLRAFSAALSRVFEASIVARGAV